MKKTKVRGQDYVPFGKLLAWQTRPIALGAVTIMIGYLSIYCTKTLMIPVHVVGIILMASKIFDGFTDLFAGWIVDNTHTRFGKGRPYEFCIIGVWICMYALFATNVEWSLTAKCIWIFIMYTLVFSCFSTLLNACETPYIIRAFGSKVAVTKVSAIGGIFITIGCMVVSISFPMLIKTIAVDAAGWRRLVMMYAIPLALLGMLRFIFVKEDSAAAKETEYEEEKKVEEKVTIRDILTGLAENKYVWFLAIASACPQLIMGMSAAVYYFEDFVGDISKYSTIQAFSMATLLIMLVFPALMKRFSGMKIVAGCSIVGFLGYILNFFAGSNMIALVFGFLLSGIASLPLSYMRAPIIMQIADYNESKNRKRMEATIGSATNFLCKVGQGLGALLIGLLLSAGGYDGQLAAQSESALFMVRLSYSIIPALFMIPVILCAIGFRPLDRLEQKDK